MGDFIGAGGCRARRLFNQIAQLGFLGAEALGYLVFLVAQLLDLSISDSERGVDFLQLFLLLKQPIGSLLPLGGELRYLLLELLALSAMPLNDRCG